MYELLSAAAGGWGGEEMVGRGRPEPFLCRSSLKYKDDIEVGVSLHPATHLPFSPLSSRRSGKNPLNCFLCRSHIHTRWLLPAFALRAPPTRGAQGPGPRAAHAGHSEWSTPCHRPRRSCWCGHLPCSSQNPLFLSKPVSHIHPMVPHIQLFSLG